MSWGGEMVSNGCGVREHWELRKDIFEGGVELACLNSVSFGVIERGIDSPLRGSPLRGIAWMRCPAPRNAWLVEPSCRVQIPLSLVALEKLTGSGVELKLWRSIMYGGERGIRTLDRGLAYTPLAGERLQPLGHLSKTGAIIAHMLGNGRG